MNSSAFSGRGGIAVFQMKNGPRIDAHGWRGRWYTLRRRVLRRLWKRIRGRAPYEMHWVARSRMEEIVAESGAELIEVLDLSGGRGKDLRYCARAASPGGGAPRAPTSNDPA